MPTLKNGRYEIPEKWNTTAMGRWLIGKDTTTGEPVFIKEFLYYRYPKDAQGHPELLRTEQRTEKFAEQMRRINEEVRRVAGSGGDVVVTTDFFREGVNLYKVTEYVDKVEWSDERDKAQGKMSVHRHLTVEQIDDMMLRIVLAISTLHQAKLLHCDLKPENVFIVQKDGKYVGMVSDFDDSFFMDQVPNGADVVGTPEYMSPELAIHKKEERDEPPVDLTAASDLFALGLMYHEYLTGDKPAFDEDYYGALWELMIPDEEGNSGTYTLNSSIDIAHRMIIDRLLQAEPEDRMQSCTQLVKAIKNVKMRRNKVSRITVMSGDRPFAGKKVSVYATYSVGNGERKREVTEKAFSAVTGKDGSICVKGLPADASYQLRWGKKKKPVIFTEADGESVSTVYLPVLDGHTITVTCDGKPLPRVKVTLGRRADGKEQVLPAKQSDAGGRVTFSKLDSEGTYWVECEGFKKVVTWDKNHCFALELMTYKLHITRGGKDLQTDVNMLLCGADGVKHSIVCGATDENGRFAFRFFKTAQAWKAVCADTEVDVAWNEQLEGEIMLKGSVHLMLSAALDDGDSRAPIEGVRMVIAQKQDGALKTLAAVTTDADGRADMGSFPEGEYHIGTVSAPEGYVPKKLKFKHPVKVMLEGENVSKRISFERVKKIAAVKDLSSEYHPEEDLEVISDRSVPMSISKKWGRVICCSGNMFVLVGRDGKTRRVAGSQLGLFGLESYK